MLDLLITALLGQDRIIVTMINRLNLAEYLKTIFRDDIE